MVAGLNSVGFNHTKLAHLVTRNGEDIDFTDESKADEIVKKRISCLFEQKTELFNKKLTAMQSSLTDEAFKNKLTEFCGQSSENDTTADLIERAKDLYAKQVTVILEQKRPTLKNNLLNTCKRHYEQRELDTAFRRSVSHIARIPLFILATAFQLTKTLFKAVVLAVPTEIYALATDKKSACKISGFEGVKRDGAFTAALTIKTFACLNPKKGVKFIYGCKVKAQIIAWECTDKNSEYKKAKTRWIIPRVMNAAFGTCFQIREETKYLSSDQYQSE